MNYIIYKDNIEINRIVAEESFCKKYCEENGYTYKEQNPPTISLEYMKAIRKNGIGTACSDAIYKGIEVDNHHYSLQDHDQLEIMNQYNKVKDGATEVPYHADGEICRMYSADEFKKIAEAAFAHILYHRTYCNHLNMWIARVDSMEELNNISYGVDLPEDLATSMKSILEKVEEAS